MLILVWLLSFNPYAVLVAGQNLLCRCCSPMNQSSVNMVTTDDKAKQINILGSRQHPAEKVALWCDFFFFFFFFKRGQIAGYSYGYKYVFNGVGAI